MSSGILTDCSDCGAIAVPGSDAVLDCAKAVTRKQLDKISPPNTKFNLRRFTLFSDLPSKD
jgi:hypothetical protein